MKREFKLGQIVYHQDVYDFNESLKIVGILEDKLLLEGDYSGGTHNSIDRDWLSVEGVSFIKDFRRKKEFRNYAITTDALAIPVDRNKDEMTRTMFDLLNMVLILTNEAELNS